jgi:hypothetical protein
MALSETVKQLIPKARIVSFAPWQTTHPSPEIALFQAADDQRLYLSDAELAQLRQAVPDKDHGLATAQLLRNQVNEIVDQARAEVLLKFPGILDPGGGLYPPERAEACWRDFWHFLRCITYGIAGGHVAYTSEPGLVAMQQLYQELQVPLDAMVYGLYQLKAASLERLVQHFGDATAQAFAPYFDHLIEQLEDFQA